MAPLPTPSAYASGEIIDGDYRVLDVKQGGFGRVYICDQLGVAYHRGNARCALKTPLAERLHDADVLDRFRAEAANWVSIPPHPNIVLAYGVEEHGRLPYIVMEYVEGGMTLAHELAAGPMTCRRAMQIGLGLSRGLAHAQAAAALSHGDLKPLNVLVTPGGTAKVTDFGVSVSLRSGVGRSEGRLAGTEGFIAPEMLEGRTVPTEASDIYAFGVTLFLALRGAGDVPSELAALVDACTRQDPAERGTFGAIVGQLERLFRTTFGVDAAPDAQPDLPSAAEGWRNASQAWLNIGDRKKAEEAARRAISADSGLWTAHNAMGLVRLEARDFAAALRHFEEAHRCGPDEVVPLTNAALACRGLGDTTGAEAWLQRAATWCADRGEVARLDAVSNLIVETWQPDAALRACDLIVSENPRAVMTWNNRAILLRKMGLPLEAYESADRAVTINPTYAKAWANRANALVELGRFEDAITSAEVALELDPTMAGPHLAKATALAQLGQHHAARAWIEKALETSPRDSQLLRARIVFGRNS